MMDMQAAPPTYAEMNTGRPPAGNPPMLGQQVPGFSGGLPAQGGLSVLANPMAQQLQSQGRGEDTMLVHMTPGEVNSLQGLAMAHGGSLTINPETGLPEAGWLGKLLPTILGAIATPLTGGLINPFTASALIGAGTGIATGNLGKGLMAGLQAYGGAALGSAAGLNAGSFGIGQAANAANAAGAGANVLGAGQDLAAGAMKSLPNNLAGITSGAQQAVASAGLPTAAFNAAPAVLGPGVDLAAQGLASLPQNLAGISQTAASAATKTPGFFGSFADAARKGLPAGTPSFIAKNAPMIAGMGVLSGVSNAMTPSGPKDAATGMIDNSYQGPYYAQQRKATFAPTTEELLSSSKERRYFDVAMPEIYNASGQVVQPGSSTVRGTPILQNYLLPTNKKTPKGSPMYGQRFVEYMGGIDPQQGYNAGGEIHLKPGGFVVDARTVSESGAGDTFSGQGAFAKYGGIPINGPGNGVSDSIKARIGDQPARVATGEVYMPPEAVKRIGGANKLYAMMDRAHKATKRGQKQNILKA